MGSSANFNIQKDSWDETVVDEERLQDDATSGATYRDIRWVIIDSDSLRQEHYRLY